MHEPVKKPSLLRRLVRGYPRVRGMAPGLKQPKAYLNWLRANYEMLRRSSRVGAKPLKLTFEPLNVCQLRCPLCPTGAKLQDREPGRADLQGFERLMDEVGDYVFFIDFFNWGEPLLNQRIEEFIARASSRRIGTRLSSNLSLELSDDRIRRLISSGLNELIVSLDGTSQGTYETYRRGGNWQLVFDNMRRILEMKREMGSPTPWVNWVFLVFRFNEHEIPTAERLAREIGVDALRVTGACLDEGFYPFSEEERAAMRTWAPESPEFNMYEPELVNGVFKNKHQPTPRSRCDWHYVSSTINPDGAVSPCCAMYEKGTDFGNLDDSPDRSYMSLINNERYVSVRDSFAGRREPTDLVCERCPAAHHMDYAKMVNREIALVTLVRAAHAITRPIRRLMGPFRRRPQRTAGAGAPRPDPMTGHTGSGGSRRYVG